MPETNKSQKPSTQSPVLRETVDVPNWKVSPDAMIFGDATVLEDPTRTDETSLRADADLNSESIKSEENLFSEVSPYYKELNDFITELRLQNVSSEKVDPDQQKLVNRLNSLYAPYNSWASDMAREKQERQEAEMRQKQEEAEAQNLMAKAEALLANVDTADLTTLESVRSHLVELAVKFTANTALVLKIDAIIDRISAVNKKEVRV